MARFIRIVATLPNGEDVEYDAANPVEIGPWLQLVMEGWALANYGQRPVLECTIAIHDTEG